MRSKFSILGIIAVIVICLTTAFVGCNNEDVNAVVKYYGKVNYINTSTPFPDLEVKVTDGDNTHCLTHTDAEGKFSLSVKVDEINGNYYILVGDSTCVTKKVNIPGFGQPEIDLGTIEIEGPKVPVVTTAKVNSVTAESAVCGGNVTDDGRLTVTARGVCWSKTEYPTTQDTHTTNGSGKGEFTSELKDLEFGMKYYVRAYATNRMGTSYGEQISFTTNTGLPIVTTGTIQNIRATSAKGGGIIEKNGYIVTGCGLCWSSVSTTPAIDGNHTSEIVNESFISTMTRLTNNTTYYCRAYATNENGVSYGETTTFTTLSGLPTITTMEVSSFTETSAKTGGKITDDGDFSIIERGVCYSLSPNPTIYDFKTIDGAGVGSFVSTITDIDLTNNSNTYYIRAYATNEVGTAYGNEVVISYQHYEYEKLPRIEYDGYIYVLYHDIGEMNWELANQTCEDFVYAGYDDWSLPSSVLDKIMESWKNGWLKSDGTPFVYIPYDEPMCLDSYCDDNIKSNDYYNFKSAAYWRKEQRWNDDSTIHCCSGYDIEVTDKNAGYCDESLRTRPSCSRVAFDWKCRNSVPCRVRPIRKYKKIFNE